MPRVIVTSPDGKRYRVTAPDGASYEQMLAFVKARIATPQPAPQKTNQEWQAMIPQDGAPLARGPAPTLGEKLTGAGEAALALGSGATTGALGYLSGTIAPLLQGRAPTPEDAMAGMAKRTYAPRTEQGQEYLKEAGELAGQYLVPFGPMTPTMMAGVPAARAVGAQARSLTPRFMQEHPGRAGAMAAPVDEVLYRKAAELPVPVNLMKGQRTRGAKGFELQQFERETAKRGDVGAPLRNRYSQQNTALVQNLDEFFDETGASVSDLRAAGENFAGALKRKATADMNRVNVAYKAAEESGELRAPVTLTGLAKYFAEEWPQEGTAPVLRVARNEAKRLGAIVETGENTFEAAPITLETAEILRKKINDAVGRERPDIRQATRIKKVIDAETENAGGDVYKAARRLRAQYAKKYESFGLASDLLGTKKGTADRKVALEDVVRKVVITPSSSLDDLQKLGRIVKTTKDGQQAWRDLQGATIDWIKSEATKNVARDQSGEPIVSVAKLAGAITNLKKGGKLQYLFGKKGAEQLEILEEVASLVHVAPPGAVNTSNTSSALLLALDMVGSGALTGVPAPMGLGLREIAKALKNRKVKKMIKKSLAPPPGYSTKRTRDGERPPSPVA